MKTAIISLVLIILFLFSFATCEIPNEDILRDPIFDKGMDIRSSNFYNFDPYVPDPNNHGAETYPSSRYPHAGGIGGGGDWYYASFGRLHRG